MPTIPIKFKISADIDPIRFSKRLKESLKSSNNNFHTVISRTLADEVGNALEELKETSKILAFRIKPYPHPTKGINSLKEASESKNGYTFWYFKIQIATQKDIKLTEGQIAPPKKLKWEPIDYGSGCLRYFNFKVVKQKTQNLYHIEFLKLRLESPTNVSLDVLKNLADYYSRKAGLLEPDDEIFRMQTRRAFGVVSQIWSLQKASHQIGSVLRERIKIYRGAEVNLLSAEVSHKNRNEAWELLAACSLARFCSDVKFMEPDIQATFNGRVLGFPCKVLYSENPSKHVARIIEGVKQLEECQAQAGFILVNLSNIIDHDAFFTINPKGEYFSYPSPEDAMQVFAAALAQIHKNLEAPKYEYNERLIIDKNTKASRRKTLGVIYYGQTLALVQKRFFLLSNAVLHPNIGADGLSQEIIDFSNNFSLAAYEMMHR